MWLSIAAAIVSALLLMGAEFTTIFGADTSGKILAVLGIFNVVVNGVNGVLHAIPSVSGPAGLAQFPLGPSVAVAK
jgi:hypothetical protein